MHSNFTAGMKRFCVYIKLLLIVVLTFFKYNTTLAVAEDSNDANFRASAQHIHKNDLAPHYSQLHLLPPNAESIFEMDVEEEANEDADLTQSFQLISGLNAFHLTCRKQEEQRFNTFPIGTHQPLGLKASVTVRFCVFRI